MSEMSEAIFKSKKALPNKLMQEDGSITDMLGNPVTDSVVEYDSKTSLPNKWMNPDGSYSTLNEIIAGAIDTDLFIIVQELPATGEDNKIYLVPKDGGTGFVEWIYADGQWDTIGELEIDLSDYPTIEEMEQYVDGKIAPQIFYYDGDTGDRGKAFWSNIIKQTTPVLIYLGKDSRTSEVKHALGIVNPSEIVKGFTSSFWFVPFKWDSYLPSSISYLECGMRKLSLTITSARYCSEC